MRNKKLVGLIVQPRYYFAQCVLIWCALLGAKTWRAFSFNRVLKHSQSTLLFYQIESQKNKRFLVLPSSIARNSQQPNAQRIFEIHRGILDLIQFIQFIHVKKHLDGAWDTFVKKSLNGTFTVHQKKTFGPTSTLDEYFVSVQKVGNYLSK